MIEVTYLNTAKQEKDTSFEDYNEFVRAQQASWIWTLWRKTTQTLR